MPTPRAGYYLADGTTKVPSVTTIIGRFKESGGLMNWAFEQGKQAGMRIAKGIEGPTRLYEASQEAKDIGSLVHDMVECSVHGQPLPERDGMSEENWQHVLAGFGAYETWRRHSRLEIVATEVQLVSETHRFGGTIDAIGVMDGEHCLPDWKTSNALYADYLVQIAAYGKLWEEHHPEAPLTGGYHLLRFSKEFGDFHHQHYAYLEAGWQAFLLMRELYDLMKVLERRVK